MPNSTPTKTVEIQNSEEDQIICDRKRICFRVFNNVKWAVLFISLANCLQNAANGLLGVSISTLEKRFNFSSIMSSIIASSYEFGQVPAVIFIMLFGHRIHRPLFFGLGMLSVSVGCFLSFLPQFILPAYIPSFLEEDAGAKVDLCVADDFGRDHGEGCVTSENGHSKYLFFFSVGRFFIGMGATPILTAGITFINDFSSKEDFALYSGVYNSMSIVGPGIGVLMSSMLLNIFVDFYRVDVSSLGFNDNDPRWIGNWWLGYVVIFLASILSAIPLFGFPNKLSGAKEMKAFQAKEGSLVNNEKLISSVMINRIKKLLKNRPFMLTCAFSACEMFIIIGFNSFGPKVFENILVIPPHVSGIVFGLVLLPSGMVGTILGGIIIQRFKLGCKKIIKIQTILSVVALLLLPTILMICQPIQFAGANVPLGRSGFSPNINNTCSELCTCDSLPYQPICDRYGVQYYSPCHAGCKSHVYSDQLKINEFYNCSCISDSFVPGLPDAWDVPCEGRTCPDAIVFLLCFAVVVCLMFVCFTMNLSVMLRVVSASRATAAVSLQVLFTKVLGTIPAPLLFGMCIDMSCAAWEGSTSTCKSGESKCVSFFTNLMARNILLICLVPKAVGCLSLLGLNFAYRPKVQANKNGAMEAEDQTKESLVDSTTEAST